MTEFEIDPNLVFAAYGRVMGKIGALEQFMRIALMQHEIARCRAADKKLDTTSWATRVMDMDLGSLSQQVCDKFKLDTDLRQVMKDAKSFRNNLAHEFWVTQFHNMQTDRGRAIVLRQCALQDEQFERITNAVLSATGVDAPAYAAFVAGNADRSEVFKEWEARLDHAEAVMLETATTPNMEGSTDEVST